MGRGVPHAWGSSGALLRAAAARHPAPCAPQMQDIEAVLACDPDNKQVQGMQDAAHKVLGRNMPK